MMRRRGGQPESRMHPMAIDITRHVARNPQQRGVAVDVVDEFVLGYPGEIGVPMPQPMCRAVTFVGFR
jgi:hypothetical protein